MSLHNIHQAKSQLSKLIELAEHGEEVIIAKAGKPVAKLVAYQANQGRRQGGQWHDKIKIAPDFDQLPQDVAAAFGMEVLALLMKYQQQVSSANINSTE